MHRAVRRRRRRLAARRRGREPGQPDALGAGPADLCHGRRRAGLCLAGRRHHADGRRDARAGQRLRLCADAGAGGADRVHAAPRRLCGARRPCRGNPQRRRRAGEGRRISQSAPRARGAAAATRGRRWRSCGARGGPRDERPAGASACRRAAAASQPRADRPDHRGVRRARPRSRAAYRAGGRAVPDDPRRNWSRSCRSCGSPAAPRRAPFAGPTARRMEAAVSPLAAETSSRRWRRWPVR